jgi:hypothetical protein
MSNFGNQNIIDDFKRLVQTYEVKRQNTIALLNKKTNYYETDFEIMLAYINFIEDFIEESDNEESYDDESDNDEMPKKRKASGFAKKSKKQRKIKKKSKKTFRRF